MLRRQAVAVAVARPYVRKVQGRRVRRWLKMQGAAGLDAMQPQTMQGVAGLDVMQPQTMQGVAGGAVPSGVLARIPVQTLLTW
jgi:hypothetical protein